MKLRVRIRELTDALPAKSRGLFVSQIAAALPDVSYNTVLCAIDEMRKRGELARTGKRRTFRYRSGPHTVTTKEKSKPRPPERMGFRALARLERDDPKAYAKLVAADRRRA